MEQHFSLLTSVHLISKPIADQYQLSGPLFDSSAARPSLVQSSYSVENQKTFRQDEECEPVESQPTSGVPLKISEHPQDHVVHKHQSLQGFVVLMKDRVLLLSFLEASNVSSDGSGSGGRSRFCPIGGLQVQNEALEVWSLETTARRGRVFSFISLNFDIQLLTSSFPIIPSLI